ncbi:putative dynein light chain, type, dynein light chain superfamily protein [Helianthus annuus]|nr:putative dynein light chain, type, dynein light chain superfamily protein [Helianthus annuus]
MLEGKAYVKDTDMQLKMQAHAMDSASQALDLYDVVDCTSIAAHIKKVSCLLKDFLFRTFLCFFFFCVQLCWLICGFCLGLLNRSCLWVSGFNPTRT